MLTNEAAAYSGENQGTVVAPEVSGTAQSQTDANAAAGAASSAGDLTEKKSGAQMLREAFSRKNETGAQTAEVAAAADGVAQEDAQNSADTVSDGEDETVGTAVEAPLGTDTAQKKTQTKEENAAFAAARRKAEGEYERKLEGERASVNALISDLGLIDPVSGKPISDVEGLRAFQRGRAETRVADVAKKAGMSDEELRALIDSHPDVAAAKEQNEAAARATAQAQLDADIKELGKLNPGIKSFADLRSLDRYDQIYGYVTQKGLSLTEGYKLAYMDDIMGQREARSAATARAQVLSKSHLSPAHGVSDGGGEVSAAEIAEVRKWGGFSKKSDSEIAAMIKRINKK